MEENIPYLDANLYKESKEFVITGVVNLPGDDPDAIEHMLCYLYKGNYSDGTNSIAANPCSAAAAVSTATPTIASTSAAIPHSFGHLSSMMECELGTKSKFDGHSPVLPRRSEY